MGIKENMLPIIGSVGDGDKIRVVTSEGESRTIEFSDFADVMPKPTGEIEITENGITDVAQYATANVNVSGGGTTSKSRKDINFFDYDGTIVESYTTSEWANVSALPSNPTHDGLTAQGWNYTKAEVDAEVTAQGKCDVGQMYITTSGATEIDIELHEGRLSPYLGICPNGTVEIDWGDGTAHDTVTGTSLTTNKDTQHNYASEGKYTIKLLVQSGSFAICGSSDYSRLLSKNVASANESIPYLSAIKEVRLGNQCDLGEYAFRLCYCLRAIAIRNKTTFTGSNMFDSCTDLKHVTLPTRNFYNGETLYVPQYMCRYCYGLKSASIPPRVNVIKLGAFQYCYTLKELTQPYAVSNYEGYAFSMCRALKNIILKNGVANITQNMFSTCYSLTTITVPRTVETIGSNAFQSCQGMAEYCFLPTTPPTMSNSNAFSNIPSDCVIYVPAESVEAYKSATNWSTYASQIQAMPE